MRRLICLPIALAFLTSALNAYAAQPLAGVVQAFGPNLRSACPLPEGLAVDPAGNLYVASVQSTPQGVICVVDRAGDLADRIPVAKAPDASNAALTGMVFSSGHGLYALDVGDFLSGGGASEDGRLLRIDPSSHGVTTIVGGFAFPNGIAEDQHRNIYVSDSARGTIYRVTQDGAKTVWSQSSLISRHANDLAFDGGYRFLYVVTTGSIVRIPLTADGSAGAAQVFADPSTSNAPDFSSGLFSDDGIAIDGQGNVFLTAAATSEIFELSSDGKLISRYSGSGPDVLDQPSALVFHQQNLYISNTSQGDGGLHAGLSVLRALPQTRGVPGFLIHGQVTDSATHVGIQGINVSAVDSSVGCCPFHTLSIAQTDSSGNYLLQVPAGSSVKIQYSTSSTNTPPYLDQWWNNKSEFDTADTLAVNAETFNINAALLRGVLVHGQVTDATSHAGIAGTNVNALDPTVNCCPFRNFSFAQTDSSGNYQMLVPAGGPVKLQFFTFGPNALPYFDQWWNNKPDFETADTLTVSVETFNINAALVRGVFVHGQVTDAATHAAIAGMGVDLHEANECCRGIAFAQTDATGNYRILAPIGSPVKLHFGTFGPNALPYLEQWWNNKPDFDTANTLTVTAETFNIDAALIQGLFIHGQVTDAATHTAIANINVAAVDPSVNCCPLHNIAFAQTDSAGNYQILVPPGSSVKLQFATFGPNALPYLEQWWNNKPDFDTADTLTVNVETFNINVALIRGVFIHGQVTDAATHAGIANIDVGAVDPSVNCCPFHNVGFAQTDSNGYYQILVRPGIPVKLQFFSFGPGALPYLEQWWNNKPDFDNADMLTVTQDTFGINVALIHAFLINGHVTDQATGQPLAGINVNALEPSGRFVGGSSTDANGDYRMAVASGSYKVRFSSDPILGSLPYPVQWWNGKPDFASADVLVVAADRFGIDAALTLGVFVHGRVTDASTGAGVERIDVDASDSTLPCCSSEDFTQTDSSGNYRLALRVGSTVRIHFFAFPTGSPPYIDLWWRNSRFFETADTLAVNSETVGIDAALAPGVFIHGQVTDAVTHAGIAGINVDVVQPNVTCCPFGDLGATQTDAKGNYTVLVPRGSPFKIQFISLPGNPHYAEQWWDIKPTFQSADTVTVNAETFGINVALVAG
jgi:sugar lactone lactonase YvrE